MGYKLLKNLNANEYNVKSFLLDHGAIDLPPIINHTDIAPGSEAHDINTMDMWILNSNWEWEKSPWKQRQGGSGGGVPDAPVSKINANYVRHTDEYGSNDWKAVDIIPEVPNTIPNAVYVRQAAEDGTFKWVQGVQDAPASTPGVVYGRATNAAGENEWVPLDVKSFKTLTTAAWKTLTTKPDYTEISDGVYDGNITNEMFITD